MFEVSRLKAMGKTPTHQVALPIVLYRFPPPAPLLVPASQEILRLMDPKVFIQLEVWREMPTVWVQSHIISGEVGKYVVVGRVTAAGDWFVAAITDQPRSLALHFVPGRAGHRRPHRRPIPDNPKDPYLTGSREVVSVNREAVWTLSLGRGGGEVITIRAKPPP